MESKKFLHDRVVLSLITLISTLTVIGASLVLIRFDAGRNPTTTVAYRPNITGSQYQSGKPIDIYSLAIFMLVTAVISILLSRQVFGMRRYLAVFMLSAQVFLLVTAIIVSNALISLQ
ncbi:MAG TPA: hypothetical protein VFP35_01370 [Candidatus Saccharimonadales bacterium]|nr:hypothetical protein [Candidatus Saccharimonadales bacterium]